MPKVTKSTPKKQVYFKRAEIPRGNACCGKPSKSAKDIQTPSYPHLKQKPKEVKNSGKDNSKRTSQ